MEKKLRVKNKIEFQGIIKSKKFISNEAYVVYYQSKAKEINRYGITVGKKLGNAVVRNKVKRQVRMIVYELSCFSLEYDCIIIVREKYINNKYIHNKELLRKLLYKLKERKNEN